MPVIVRLVIFSGFREDLVIISIFIEECGMVCNIRKHCQSVQLMPSRSVPKALLEPKINVIKK